MSVVLIRLKIGEKAQPPLGGFLYLGLSTRASLFWAGSGHGCGNGGIYHPPDLPLMDSQLGSSWAHIGWGSRLARVQIFLDNLFARRRSSQ